MAAARALCGAVLALGLAACAPGVSPSPPEATPGPASPRFAAGGVDAAANGAADGYPLGNRSTFFRLPYLVGSHSHLDEIFEPRVVRRSARPSALARAAAVP